MGWAYSFSATTGSNTLYFRITDQSNKYVHVTPPAGMDENGWDGYTKPTGSLSIPSSVTYNGSTYSVKGMDNYAFSGCDGLTSVTIPSSISTSVSGTFPNHENACWFKNCSGLRTVSIPSTFKTIPYQMFSMCTSLQSVSLPNVKEIHEHAFLGCSSLTSITIPSSIESIGWMAFDYCTGLSSITIQATTPPFAQSNVFPSNSLLIYVPCGYVDDYQASSYWSSYTNIQGHLLWLQTWREIRTASKTLWP